MSTKKLKQKRTLGKLYNHIPQRIKKDILVRTDDFDRIGPITIPSEINSNIVELILFYYTFYESKNDYFLITKNSDLNFENPFLRISSNCFYAYTVNSRRCDCKWQLDYSLKLLQEQTDNNFLIIFAVDDHGKGIDGGLRGHALLYALGQKLKQELIFDAYERNGFNSEYRNYVDIHLILKSLSVKKIKLLTNNPLRVTFFRNEGYMVEQITIEKPYDKYLSEELGMKKEKLGHNLVLDGFEKKDIGIYGLSEDSFNS